MGLLNYKSSNWFDYVKPYLSSAVNAGASGIKGVKVSEILQTLRRFLAHNTEQSQSDDVAFAFLSNAGAPYLENDVDDVSTRDGVSTVHAKAVAVESLEFVASLIVDQIERLTLDEVQSMTVTPRKVTLSAIPGAYYVLGAEQIDEDLFKLRLMYVDDFGAKNLDPAIILEGQALVSFTYIGEYQPSTNTFDLYDGALDYLAPADYERRRRISYGGKAVGIDQGRDFINSWVMARANRLETVTLENGAIIPLFFRVSNDYVNKTGSLVVLNLLKTDQFETGLLTQTMLDEGYHSYIEVASANYTITDESTTDDNAVVEDISVGCLSHELYDVDYNPVEGDPDSEDVYSLYTYLTQLSAKMSLNDAINDATTLLVSGKFTIENYAAVMNAKYQSLKGSALRFSNGLKSAYAQGGFLTACQYVLKYVQQPTSADIDSDGFFTFTDNSALVVKEWIIGSIGTIISSIASVVGAIIAMFSRILGLLMAGVGAVVSSVSKWIDYDVDKLLNAQINISNSLNAYPAFPMALCQITIDVANVEDQLLVDFFNQHAIFQIPVPGGFIFGGVSEFTDEHQDVVKTVSMEFHPGLSTCECIQDTISDSLCTWHQVDEIHDDSSAFGRNFLWMVRNSGVQDFTIDKLVNWWSHSKAIDLDFGADGVLTSDSDDHLRLICLRNISIFSLWLRLLDSSQVIGSESVPFAIEKISTPPLPNDFAQLMYNNNLVNWDLIWLDEEMVNSYLTICGSGALNDVPSWASILSWVRSVSSYDYISAVGLLDDVFYTSWGHIFHGLNQNQSVSVMATAFYNAAASKYGSDMRGYLTASIIDPEFFVGDVLPVPDSEFIWQVKLPEYNAATFWGWTAAFIAASTVLIAGTVIASMKVKKWLTLKRASNAAKVENAWDAVKKNPNDRETLDQYRKTAKSANLQSNLIGGSKFNASGFWSPTDTQSSDEAPEGKTESMTDAVKLIRSMSNQDTVDITENFDVRSKQNVECRNEDIYQIISGRPFGNFNP